MSHVMTKPFRHGKIEDSLVRSKNQKLPPFGKFAEAATRCSMKKGVLRSFTKFTGKHLCQSLKPATLLNKRLWHRCFTVNFAKFLRTPVLRNTSGRQLLNLSLRC